LLSTNFASFQNGVLNQWFYSYINLLKPKPNMDYDINEIITKLYAENMVNTAAIKLLTGMLFGYLDTVDKVKHDAMKKFFDDHLSRLVEQEVLKSELKDEYLEHFSQNALRKYLDQLGL
jgi:hypothetical protein